MLTKDSKLSDVTMEVLKSYKYDRSALTLLLFNLEEQGLEGEVFDEVISSTLSTLIYEFGVYEALILHTLDYAREIYKNEIPEEDIDVTRVIADVYDYVGIE